MRRAMRLDAGKPVAQLVHDHPSGHDDESRTKTPRASSHRRTIANDGGVVHLRATAGGAMDRGSNSQDSGVFRATPSGAASRHPRPEGSATAHGFNTA
jgi:hypothetical protein